MTDNRITATVKGFKITAKYIDSVEGFPFDKTDKQWHNKFNVTVTKGGVRRLFPFYGSAWDFDQGRKDLNGEGLKDAFRAFLEDAIEGTKSYEDFCADLGFDTDSRRAERTWKACIKSYQKIQGFGLTDNELYDLVNSLNG